MKNDNDILNPHRGNQLPLDDAKGNLTHIEAMISTGRADDDLSIDLSEALDRMVEQHSVLHSVWRGRLTKAEHDRVTSELSRKGRSLWAALRYALKGKIRLQKIGALSNEDFQTFYDMVFVKSRNLSKGRVFDFWQLSDGLLEEIRDQFDEAQIEAMDIRSIISALEDNHTELGMLLRITVEMPSSSAAPSVRRALLNLRQTTRQYVLRLRFLAELDPTQADRVKHLLVPLKRWQEVARQDRKDKVKAQKAAAKKAEAQKTTAQTTKT